MRKVSSVLCVGILVFMSGCAVHKDLVPTAGNRAGGTVTLSYQYGLFQKPIINPAQGEAAAKQRCAAWGYTGAEPFGGGLRTCEARNGYGECILTRVNITYQCTGNPSASHG